MIIDLLIISGDPKIYLPDLLTRFIVKKIVFDGSVPSRKIRAWEKQCDSCRVQYYNVSEQGALVMKID